MEEDSVLKPKTNSTVKSISILLVSIISLLPSLAVIIDFWNKNFTLGPYLPVLIGIPAAATTAFLVVYIVAMKISSPEIDKSNADKVRSNPHLKLFNPYYLILLWLLCFLCIVFSIWALLPNMDRKSGSVVNSGDQKRNIEITLLQLNDVYEISTLDDDKIGGLSRVATLLKQLKNKHANVYTVLAGDFLSPSALGTINEIKGRQMIDVLNALPVDLVTFGNHEFDLKENDLKERINHSKFAWVSSNVVKSTNQAFTKSYNGIQEIIPVTKVITFHNETGDSVKMGILGLTIDSNPADYVKYLPVEGAIEDAMSDLKVNGAEIIISITHLERAKDTTLARRFKKISLFVGGHEHTSSIDTVGKSFVTKADANVRTVYVHTLIYNPNTKEISIKSELISIDNRLQKDRDVQDIVNKWNNLADSIWRRRGYNPCEVLTTLKQPLDGTEASVRYKPTDLTTIIAKAIYEACPVNSVDASLYNSGSIRIDDTIKNRVTQYDIIRAMPYSGKIYIATVTGELLEKLLTISKTNRGNGCFLQHYKIDSVNNFRYINGRKFNVADTYRIAVNDFLIKGEEKKMNFFNYKVGYKGLLSTNTVFRKTSLRKDIVLAVSSYLRKPSLKFAQKTKQNQVPCF